MVCYLLFDIKEILYNIIMNVDLELLENEIKNDTFDDFKIKLIDKTPTDINKSLYLRFYLKHNIKIIFEHDIMIYKDDLIEYPITLNIIKDTYKCLSNLLSLRKHINDWEEMYKNPYFFKLTPHKQYEYIKNLYIKFLSIFDGGKSLNYIFIKLKGITIPTHDIIHDIVERLTLTCKMFKHSFFDINKIKIITLHELIDIEFQNKVKYLEYIFKKISNILKTNIDYYETYIMYIDKLNNIMNPHNIIEIEMDEVSSDLDDEDLNFINS